MHIVKVHSWLNGELSTFEEAAESFEHALSKVGAHHKHHSANSDSHTIKVYNDAGDLVHTQNNEETAEEPATYA